MAESDDRDYDRTLYYENENKIIIFFSADEVNIDIKVVERVGYQ